MEDETTGFTAYFTEEEKRLLVILAKTDDRSMNKTLARLIREEANRRGIASPAKTEAKEGGGL